MMSEKQYNYESILRYTLLVVVLVCGFILISDGVSSPSPNAADVESTVGFGKAYVTSRRKETSKN